jgi:hypothetical protein
MAVGQPNDFTSVKTDTNTSNLVGWIIVVFAQHLAQEGINHIKI